mmetsp:Transcript_20746/g.52952  ORF Transcript_20746/g.52952 Transcript_20746/m.52952 type:complete len:303 (+) Transcript_20746:678-1586(+)
MRSTICSSSAMSSSQYRSLAGSSSSASACTDGSAADSATDSATDISPEGASLPRGLAASGRGEAKGEASRRGEAKGLASGGPSRRCASGAIAGLASSGCPTSDAQYSEVAAEAMAGLMARKRRRASQTSAWIFSRCRSTKALQRCARTVMVSFTPRSSNVTARWSMSACTSLQLGGFTIGMVIFRSSSASERLGAGRTATSPYMLCSLFCLSRGPRDEAAASAALRSAKVVMVTRSARGLPPGDGASDSPWVFLPGTATARRRVRLKRTSASDREAASSRSTTQTTHVFVFARSACGPRSSA